MPKTMSLRFSSKRRGTIKTYKNLNIKFTYQLSRGGIVVHTDTEEEVNILKSSWDLQAFSNSGEFLKVHEVQQRYRCVLKNVPVIVSETEFKETHSNQVGEDVQVRRLRYKVSGKPMKIAVTESQSQEAIHKLFNSKLFFRNKESLVTHFRSKKYVPTRCYNCQRFSHVAKMCTEKTVCENCGKQHTNLEACQNPIKCINCDGNHKTSSTFCPVYMELLDRLKSRD